MIETLFQVCESHAKKESIDKTNVFAKIQTTFSTKMFCKLELILLTVLVYRQGYSYLIFSPRLSLIKQCN